MSAAVISGSFADYRLVKSRSVLQLVIEIPVENQGAAFAALGYPLPGVEISVVVARMNPRGGPEPEVTGNPLLTVGDREATKAPLSGTREPSHSGNGALNRGEGRTVGSIPATGAKSPAEGTPKTPGERAVIRAAILCGEPRFGIWLTGAECGSEIVTADALREACGIKSRAEIAKDPAALERFLRLETKYLLANGLMAEPR